MPLRARRPRPVRGSQRLTDRNVEVAARSSRCRDHLDLWLVGLSGSCSQCLCGSEPGGSHRRVETGGGPDEECCQEPSSGGSARDLITFVQDRAGHDWRYAIDASKVQSALGFTPAETFETGIAKTIDWYLANESWWRPLL